MIYLFKVSDNAQIIITQIIPVVKTKTLLFIEIDAAMEKCVVWTFSVRPKLQSMMLTRLYL